MNLKQNRVTKLFNRMLLFQGHITKLTKKLTKKKNNNNIGGFSLKEWY